MVTFFQLGIMKKFILTCLCNAVLLVILCLPTEARMIVGLTPVAPLSGIEQTALNQLSKQLETSAGTDVKIRSFENDAAITNWLLRFQEIDAAIVSPGFIEQHPAGTLKHLADLHTRNSPSSPLALVIRSNLSSNQTTLIKEAFIKLSTSDAGRNALGSLGLSGVTNPGEPLKHKTSKAAKVRPPTAQPVKKKAPLPTTKTANPIVQKPQPKVIAVPKKLEVKPQATAKTVGQETKEKIVVPKVSPKAAIEKPDKSEPAAEVSKKLTVQKPVMLESEPAGQAKQVEAKKEPEVELKAKAEDKLKPIKQELPSESPQPGPEPNKRVALFVALVLLLAILFKATLFFMRWQSKKKSTFKPGEAPTIETALEREEVVVPGPFAEANSVEPDDDEELVIEEGRLGPGKVPALLKRCADLPKPVVLKITKGSCEKLVYFAGGQVSAALTQNATTSESGVRWNKLGNLLVREELITRDERDQGMALLIKEPELRFGEALLKLGLIDLAGLRHALTRQAKVTIYSLILFPEGLYQVFAGEGSLPPEESISLEITSLIREASHHQSEWAAIRQALPSLNTALDFSPDGRSKLEKVGLSPQQEAVLSLIDGKCTINELCIESSMMDYEVYRFLYLMVKASVLE